MTQILHFNDILLKTGLHLDDVRLLRHQEYGPRGQTPYSLWVESPDKLRRYQEVQRTDRRPRFAAPFWASFVVQPDGKTMFVGIFAASLRGPANAGYLHPFDEKPLPAGEIGKVDQYDCLLTDHIRDLIGRLIIEWGPGTRSWVQRADSDAGRNKPIAEIRERFSEPHFPGYKKFISTLSGLANLPMGWRTALSSVSGIYLLTCPRTKEQYVGQAFGEAGFWGRWLSYVATGHGGNVGLKSRDLSDYQVSILEICGSDTTKGDLDFRESLWKRKLQSREMGLNRN
ncbi:GIY-YIG nuclease family protein [Sphingopyxis sp.]|uniref:GIY-YIG nuclease family protein n=1 Tax=Sphingopyxis sp. TaxID=1908224 RepID=UPI0035B1FED4